MRMSSNFAIDGKYEFDIRFLCELYEKNKKQKCLKKL